MVRNSFAQIITECSGSAPICDVFSLDYSNNEDLEQLAFDDENILTPKEAKMQLEPTDVVDVLEELGIGRKKKQMQDAQPLNKYWLHDTPGAINDAQVQTHSYLLLAIRLITAD